MNYLVNDIENLLIMDRLKLLELIQLKCHSIVISKARVNEFSFNKIRLFSNLDGVSVIDADIDFFEFVDLNKNHLVGLSYGDKSSIYLTKTLGATLVTFNSLIYIAAKKLNIKVIKTDELLEKHINNSEVLNLFNEVKM